jgi:hypothetical protein
VCGFRKYLIDCAANHFADDARLVSGAGSAGIDRLAVAQDHVRSLGRNTSSSIKCNHRDARAQIVQNAEERFDFRTVKAAVSSSSTRMYVLRKEPRDFDSYC